MAELVDFANQFQEFDRCFDLSDTRTICVTQNLKEIRRMTRNIGLFNQPTDFNTGTQLFPGPNDSGTEVITESYYSPVQNQLWIRVSDLRFQGIYWDGTQIIRHDPADILINHGMTRIIKIFKLWPIAIAPAPYTDKYLRVFEITPARNYQFEITDPDQSYDLVSGITPSVVITTNGSIMDIVLQDSPHIIVLLSKDPHPTPRILQLYKVNFNFGPTNDFELKFQSDQSGSNVDRIYHSITSGNDGKIGFLVAVCSKIATPTVHELCVIKVDIANDVLVDMVSPIISQTTLPWGTIRQITVSLSDGIVIGVLSQTSRRRLILVKVNHLCHTFCQTCFKNENNMACSSCGSGRTLINSQCWRQCAPITECNHSSDNDQCIIAANLDPNCGTCQNENACQICLKGFENDPNDAKKCICPAGKFINPTSDCVPCTIQDCSECSWDNFASVERCDKCKVGFSVNAVDKLQCVPCFDSETHNQCAECIFNFASTQRECMVCLPTFDLTTQFGESVTKCWKTCTGNEKVDTDNMCKPCPNILMNVGLNLYIDPNCATCSYTNSRWVCLTCRAPFSPPILTTHPTGFFSVEICRCPAKTYSNSLGDNTCRSCNFQRTGCSDCIDGGGRCYECEAGFTFLNPSQQSNYQQQDQRITRTYSPHIFSLTPNPDATYGVECKKNCPQGDAWTAPNDCSTCLQGCRRCDDITFTCRDTIIDFKISEKVISDRYKLKKHDYFLRVEFEVLGQDTQTNLPWLMRLGETISMDRFLKIDSMTKKEVIQRRVLQKVIDPQNYVKMDFEVVDLPDSTELEIGFSYEDIAEGHYEVTFITDGSKQWIPTLGGDSRVHFFSLGSKPITLYNKDKEKSTEIESAKNLGSFVENVTYISIIASHIFAIGGTLVTTGFGVPFFQFLQMMKLINRVRYIGTDFGLILTAFMEATSWTVQDSSDQPLEVLQFSGKSNNKLDKYWVQPFILKRLHWPIALYLISYSLKFLIDYFVRGMRKVGKVDVVKCKVIFYMRKSHYLIFNIFVCEFFFFGVHTILHLKMKDIFSMLNVVMAYAVLVVLIFDIRNQLRTSALLKQANFNYHHAILNKKKIEAQTRIRQTYYKAAREVRKKNNLIKEEQKKQEQLDLLDSSAVALNKKKHTKQQKANQKREKNNQAGRDEELNDLELEKTVRVSLKGYQKIIDQKKTLVYLSIDESVISYLYTEIIHDNLLIFSNFFIRNNQLIFVLRMSVYLVFLVTNQWLPEFQSLAIFVFELFHMFTVVMSFLQSKHLRSKSVFFLKVMQSILMLIFLILVMVFAFNHEETQRSKGLQNIGILFLMILFVFEIGALLFNVVKHTLAFSRHIMHKSRLKKVGEDHIDSLQVLDENIFFYYLSEQEKSEILEKDELRRKAILKEEQEEEERIRLEKEKQKLTVSEVLESQFLESQALHGSMKEKLRAARKLKKEEAKKGKLANEEKDQKEDLESLGVGDLYSQKSVNIVLQNPKVVQVKQNTKLEKVTPKKPQKSSQETKEINKSESELTNPTKRIQKDQIGMINRDVIERRYNPMDELVSDYIDFKRKFKNINQGIAQHSK